jgi:hypothetical protein
MPVAQCLACGLPLTSNEMFCLRCGRPVSPGGGRSARWPWIAIPAAVLVSAGLVSGLVLYLRPDPSPVSMSAPQLSTQPQNRAASPDSVESLARREVPVLVGSLDDWAVAEAPSHSPNSVDGAGTKTSYGADHLLDDDPTTAWRTDGDATGETLTFTLDSNRPVTTLGLVNGFAKIDRATGEDRYWQERRILRVTWTVGGRSFRQSLEDGDRTVQKITIGAVSTSVITLRVDRVSRPESKRFDRTVISDVLIANR